MFVELRDEERKGRSTGRVGRNPYRWATIIREYFNNPAATEEAWKAVLHLGRHGSLDDEDIYTSSIVEGHDHQRREKIFRTTSRKFSTDIRCRMAAVVGAPDPKWGRSWSGR